LLKHPRRKPCKYYSLLGLLRWGKVNQKTKSKSGLDFDVDFTGPLTEPKSELKTGNPSARMFERAVYASSAAALFLMSDEGSPCFLWAEGSGCVSFGSFSFAQAKKMNTPVGAGTHIF